LLAGAYTQAGFRFEFADVIDVALAQSDGKNPFNTQLGEIGPIIPAEITEQTNPIELVMSWIQVALTFLGVATIALVLYAGFLWMTAAGESEKIDKAKKYLRNGLIGLIIILSSWSLTWFIVKQIQILTASY